MTASTKLTAMIPDPDVAALIQLADRNERSIAAEIRLAIREHLSRAKERENGADR